LRLREGILCLLQLLSRIPYTLVRYQMSLSADSGYSGAIGTDAQVVPYDLRRL
jgi:hypothetical protein